MRLSTFGAFATLAAGQYNPTDQNGLEKIVADVKEKCFSYIDTGRFSILSSQDQ